MHFIDISAMAIQSQHLAVFLVIVCKYNQRKCDLCEDTRNYSDYCSPKYISFIITNIIILIFVILLKILI